MNMNTNVIINNNKIKFSLNFLIFLYKIINIEKKLKE